MLSNACATPQVLRARRTESAGVLSGREKMGDSRCMRILILVFAAACWHGETQAPTKASPPPRPTEPDLASVTYDRDVADVYAAAIEVVRERYPNLDDDEAKHTIKTAWHVFEPPTGTEAGK